MSGLNRCMAVLRLYSEEAPAWTVPAMAEALQSPISTIYRAVSDLVKAGLLEAATESRYRLGAAFIAFDRLTRLTDPLVQNGRGVLAETVAGCPIACVGLLCRLYDGTVMCVADAATRGADFRSSYERGRPMPLTSGATSKVILAQLPARRLKGLLQASVDGAFRAGLAEIRRQGFAITRGEIDSGMVGIAAAVVAVPLGLIASLSLVVRAADLAEGSERDLVGKVVSAAALLSGSLAGS
jgi:DNA-binding IclR family transcriptional regulator